GKTRLCEEVSRECARNGARVVSARQAHSTEFPRRILANLLLELADIRTPEVSPSQRIENVVARLEPGLAARARPTIDALCGQAGKPGSLEDDQALVSVLVVLVAQICRSNTLVVHLHDLHWCTLDVLETLDRLIWQLDHLRLPPCPGGSSTRLRVLFLL